MKTIGLLGGMSWESTVHAKAAASAALDGWTEAWHMLQGHTPVGKDG